MATTTWNLEPAHSEMQFKVRHMMISNVTGNFQKFDAKIESEGDDFSTAKVSFSADIDSISTNNEQRDQHLKSADFFDSASHKQVTFANGTLQKVSGDDYKLNGELTLRGVTNPVTLDVEFGGIVKDPWGMTRAGFTLEGKINRKDFGISWGAALEAGGVVVSDEVRIHANVEFVKQEQQPA
jgi:polyisoprenoid-binding protein YceI